jgi:hypothetical protein
MDAPVKPGHDGGVCGGAERKTETGKRTYAASCFEAYAAFRFA